MEILQPKNTIPLLHSSLYFKQIWNTVADIGIISRQFIDRCSKESKKEENIYNLIQEDKIQKVQKDLSIKRR